jgi:drug/metabolite transporter (DMT)-like permease
VSLSLVAVKYAYAGVAATLMSLVPVLIIVPSVILFGEKVSRLAVLGALIAVTGSALLF